MRYILFILLIATITFSCKKDVAVEIKGTRDLKNLSLSRLKTFLNGKWSLHRLEYSTIAGVILENVPDSVEVNLIFYPIDSVKRSTTLSSRIIMEKLVYKYLNLPGMGKSAYVLLFDADVNGYRYKWVADSLVNDTLIFTNYFQSEGLNHYYYTKEQ